MWAAIIVVVLICGYHYTKCHLPSNYQQSRATGWNAYFDVALRGGVFFLTGLILAAFVFFGIHLVMYIFNIPSYFSEKYHSFSFATDFFQSGSMA